MARRGMQGHRRTEPAHIAIARRLGTDIVTGAISPGDLLPGEIDIAGREGVARSVIREAMRMLGSKRLIESRPKAGTHVRAMKEWNLLDPDVLQWMFSATPSKQFVRDLFQLRLIVEPAAAAIAAPHRDARQLSQMGHALEEMAQFGLGTAKGRAADERFHVLLLEATGNALLASLSSSISAAVRWTTLFKYQQSRPPGDPVPQHRTLFEAIANSNPEAARVAATTLVERALADTEAVLRGAGPPVALRNCGLTPDEDR